MVLDDIGRLDNIKVNDVSYTRTSVELQVGYEIPERMRVWHELKILNKYCRVDFNFISYFFYDCKKKIK